MDNSPIDRNTEAKTGQCILGTGKRNQPGADHRSRAPDNTKPQVHFKRTSSNAEGKAFRLPYSITVIVRLRDSASDLRWGAERPGILLTHRGFNVGCISSF